MTQIPDAPWVRDPERYADDYYGGSIYENDGDEYARRYASERMDNDEEDYI